MTKIWGQLERAQFENVTSLPSAGIAARALWNLTDGKGYIDDETAFRSILLNDGKAIFGLDGTAADNVRFHRGGSARFQFVTGDDTTSDDSVSSSLAECDFAHTMMEDLSSAPSNPEVGHRKLYFKGGSLYQKDSSGTETKIGSGGASGINYIDNADAETGTTGWADYADAAGEDPVDGTGGSPTAAISRVTSTPLRGSGMFRLTKDAADRQGEGSSFDFTIDNADKSKQLSISFDYAVSANFALGDASDVRVWIYDVTNAQLIAPSNTKLTSTSKFEATFNTTDSTSYRFILHIATTNASAWTMDFDNVQVGPQERVFGVPVSDYEEYTPTIGGLGAGSTSTNTAFWKRVGDSVEIIGEFTKDGTPGSGSANLTVGLPSTIPVIDTAKLPNSTNKNQVGVLGQYPVGNHEIHLAVVDVSDTGAFAFIETGATTLVTGADVPASSVNWYKVSIPISGWSADVVQQNARTFRISDILVNGTRVTSTPTKLGEYRCYIKDISAVTATDNAPTGNYAPSVANGMGIDGSVVYGSAGTSGQPGRWEIFVGKNKHVRFDYCSSLGRTGYLDVDYVVEDPLVTVRGLLKGYDPTTGVAFLDGIIQQSDTTTRHAGLTIAVNGGAISGGNTAYFDIHVSEKVIPVSVEADGSQIYLDTANGHGSSGTKIRTFANSTINGDSLTYTSDSTNGDYITVNRDGIYAISYNGDAYSVANTYLGISKNASTTTNISSLAVANLLSFIQTASAGVLGAVSVTVRLVKGDIIRPHDNGLCDGTSGARFVMVRVGD